MESSATDANTASVNDELLINIIHCNPILYDKSDPNYKDAGMKNIVWSNVAVALNRNVDDIIQRWNMLRSMFSREDRIQTGKSGDGAINPNRKEWPLYKNMLFMQDHIAHRKTASNYSTPSTALSQSPTEPSKSSAGPSAVWNDVLFLPLPDDVACSSGSPASKLARTGGIEVPSNLKGQFVTPPPDTQGANKLKIHADVMSSISETSKAIASAVADFQLRRSTTVPPPVEEGEDYYLSQALNAALKRVPAAKKTECFARVISVIAEFELHTV